MEEKQTQLKIWKTKRILETLEKMKPGTNTSVFTLILRPNDQVIKIRAMLNDEISRSSNIKSGPKRLSVQEGLKSINEHLKSFRSFPPNGLVCFYASHVDDQNQSKKTKFKMYFEPPKPVTRFVYNCGETFETSTLKSMLQDEMAVGYIIIDGKGSLFATVRGNNKQIHLKLSVDLPRKHAKGGQSAVRFARLREDARKSYLIKICEKATEVFISDNVPTVSIIILAGQAQFKDQLERCSHLDQRVKELVHETLTVDYGGESGLNEAIKLSTETISSMKLGQEIKIINTFMDHLNHGDENMVAYGIYNVMNALEDGAVDTIILWQELPVKRWEVKDKDLNRKILYLKEGEKPEDNNIEQESELLIDWLINNVDVYRTKLELVSDQSVEGNMIVQGFDGLVAILRYSRVQEDD